MLADRDESQVFARPTALDLQRAARQAPVAIRTDGTLWAWGSNNVGQLGDGTTTNRPFPTRIGVATDWTLMAGGVLHTIARRGGW